MTYKIRYKYYSFWLNTYSEYVIVSENVLIAMLNNKRYCITEIIEKGE